jgi:hypothetical protein
MAASGKISTPVVGHFTVVGTGVLTATPLTNVSWITPVPFRGGFSLVRLDRLFAVAILAGHSGIR